jgi:23S rRNA (uridine2552-2'-O)-methyltransferase
MRSERSRSRFGEDSLESRPVKVGDVVDVDIVAEGKRGDGVGKYKGFVVFVQDARKGDTVSVKITDLRPKFAIGERV